ncbi:hypothetical protein HNR23_003671 [Nocardiopsis mwathae]|uniref:Uncharacterized protein n=1 Tax=Nocardiopsis mwathae TaxID=1472723 RepID=A0A7W9YL87_9ACTN|nr:hypothetical protein [Nocardiopsis mwathae]MBB6173611.1 hypothetical protein [Nocardiopsis mwathae]
MIPRHPTTRSERAPGGFPRRWAVAASAAALTASLTGCLDEDGADGDAAPPAPPPLGTPEEVVAGMVDLIDSAESYLVDLDAEVAAGEGGYAQHETFVLSTDPEPVFQWFERFPAIGDGDAYEQAWLRVGGDGPILFRTTYASAPREDRFYSRAGADATAPPLGPEHTLSRDPVGAPVKDLAATMSVAEEDKEPGEGPDGDDGAVVRYSGTFDLTSPAAAGEKAEVQEGVPFELRVDEHAHPTGLTYETVTGPHTWTYHSIDAPPATRYCGTVEGVPHTGTARVVPTHGDIACDEAVDVVERYLEMPDGQKDGTGYLAEVDGWTCGIRTRAEIDGRTAEDVARCSTDWPETTRRVDLLRVD